MSDRETVDFLATVPLLADRDEEDLEALARVVRRRTVRAGETLWRQGEEGRELLFVVDGALSASLRLPGDRTVEVWRAGRGEAVGEIALLDGNGHTMSVHVSETATVLALGRLEFAALLARQDPSAFRLKRSLAALFTSRLRNQLGNVAQSLGGDVAGPRAEDAARTFAELSYCGRPTAGMCAEWRPSTISIRLRSGAS
jgi:CRP-like cAMP-binding protein